MALSNIFGWNKKDSEQTAAACGVAYDAGGKKNLFDRVFIKGTASVWQKQDSGSSASK